MRFKNIIFTVLLIFISLALAYYLKPSEHKQQQRNIVVVFTVLEDFAKQLLKNVPDVKIHTLITYNQNPHSFHPHPKICVLLKKADAVVINGLDFEHWFNACREQISGKLVVASDNVVPLRQVNNPSLFDPHAWHDVKNAIVYVRNMRNSFKEVYPQFSEIIEYNYQDFIKELEDLDTWISQQFANLKDRTIITTHDAFWYYGKSYGIQFISPQGINTEEEIFAAKMVQIIKIIKERQVKALFLENLSNSAAIKQLAQETDTKIGGTLYADSLSEPTGSCPTYVSMIRHNTLTIKTALSK